jgi:hypothetical protein
MEEDGIDEDEDEMLRVVANPKGGAVDGMA